MAISFQNNLFNNLFGTNAFNNLKPQVRQEEKPKTDEKAENKEKVASTDKSNRDSTATNPIESLQSSIASKLLQTLTNFSTQRMANQSNLSQVFENIANKAKDAKDIVQKTREEMGMDKLESPDKPKGAISSAGMISGSFVAYESITYSLNYDSASGQYSHSLSYSAGFVANFNTALTDKNGNQITTQSKLALGENFTNQITGGLESLTEDLKKLFEGQTFEMEFDGDFGDFGEELQNSLKDMLFLFESKDNSIAQALQTPQSNALTSDKESQVNRMGEIFDNLKNALQSSLEMFAGIPKNETSPALPPVIQEWFKNQNNLTITTSYEQYNAQWIGRKLDNSSLFFGSLNAFNASLRLEA